MIIAFIFSRFFNSIPIKKLNNESINKYNENKNSEFLIQKISHLHVIL